jgi:putative ABC transport system permease protein
MSTIRTVSFLAAKDLKRDKKIAALVVFLLAFSYFNITFFAAFINGLGNTFQDEIVNTATSHIILTPSNTETNKYIPDVSSIVKKIEANPEVVGVTAHLNVPLTISYKNKQMSLSATGLQASDESRVTTIPSYILDGSFLTDNSNDEVVLGKYIAGQRIEDTLGQQTFGSLVGGLGVRVGDVVTIRYASGITKNYRVRGIAGSNGFSMVSQSVYITRHEAESVLDTTNQASSILVRLNDRNDADLVKNYIFEQGVAGVDVRTWSEASGFVSAINSTFGIVTFATSFVGIMIVVVTIGIVIFINTSRKKRIIGVLKAIGMDSNQIMLIFLVESFIFGIIGTLLGIGIFSGVTYYLTVNPVSLPIGNLVPSLAASTVISTAIVIVIASIVAGYVPARMASRQEILETIKTVE